MPTEKGIPDIKGRHALENVFTRRGTRDLIFMDAKELTELLNKYPDIKKRVEEMLLFVDGAKEEISLADEAEERVIEGVRGIGFSLMENWARRQVNKSSERIKKSLPKAQKHSKKKSAGKQRLGE